MRAPGLAAIPPSYEWAARVHGAGAGMTTRRIIAPLLWPHCLAGAILIFSISFRELVGSVLLRPPGMQTVSTFILREFDQGSPATGMAMGVIAISVSMMSVASHAGWCRKNHERRQRRSASVSELQIGPDTDVIRRPKIWIVGGRLIEAQTGRLDFYRFRNPDVIDAAVEALPFRMSRIAAGLRARV